jgi:hypothetical protein
VVGGLPTTPYGGNTPAKTVSPSRHFPDASCFLATSASGTELGIPRRENRRCPFRQLIGRGNVVDRAVKAMVVIVLHMGADALERIRKIAWRRWSVIQGDSSR